MNPLPSDAGAGMQAVYFRVRDDKSDVSTALHGNPQDPECQHNCIYAAK